MCVEGGGGGGGIELDSFIFAPSQGFGKWDGIYLNIYEGYLFRVGLIVEWNSAQDIVSWSNGSDTLSVVVNATGAPGRYIQLNFTNFQARQFSVHATVVGEGANDV